MVVSTPQTILADAAGGDHMGGLGWGFGWGMMGMGWLVMLIVLILVIWAINRLVDRPSRVETVATASAGKILADRYARGAIDGSEYRERLSELNL